MNDPHIDIDEIDNSFKNTEPRRGGEVPPASSTQPGQTADFGTDNFRPASGYNPAEMFSGMAQQFRRWQEQSGFGFGRTGFGFVPPETIRHLRASQREFLLAWRSFIDYSLERLEQQELRDQVRAEAEMTGAGSPRTANKIIVEEIDD